MPNYNGALYLEEAVRSVTSQTFRDLEIIVADDNSDDASLEIIRRLSDADKRVRVAQSATARQGPALCRNRAIALANGRYLAFLDSDDTWLPQKLASQLELHRMKSCKLTFTALRKMNSNGSVAHRTIFPKAEVSYNDLLSRNYLPCSSVIIDRSLTGEILMPDIYRRQDYALWLQLLRDGGLAYGHPHPLLCYRVYAESFSASKTIGALYHWKVLRQQERLPLINATKRFTQYAISAGTEYFRGRLALD